MPDPQTQPKPTPWPLKPRLRPPLPNPGVWAASVVDLASNPAINTTLRAHLICITFETELSHLSREDQMPFLLELVHALLDAQLDLVHPNINFAAPCRYLLDWWLELHGNTGKPLGKGATYDQAP